MSTDKEKDDIILADDHSDVAPSDKDKVDILFEEEVGEEQLSLEEQMQADLATAERYLNIAGHMKQFEDQDKYYTRAIRYIRKARNYFRDVAKDPELAEVYTDAIRKLARIKFTIRSEGKVSLYNEACNIRDHAKTPSDYYNAYTVFERIHKYEIKHPIQEKWITPELYEETKKCEDSEEQAQICNKLGVEKAKQLRRHSLVVSILFIGFIAAFLAFSRTTQFRHLLGNLEYAVGDYEDAWGAYKYVIDRGDTTLYDKYIETRYKAGLQAEKHNNLSMAIGDFRASAAENYKDSDERLIKLELKRLRNPEKYDSGLGLIIPFGGVDWRILEMEDDKIFLLKDSAMKKDPLTEERLIFDQEAGADLTWENSDLRKWLNNPGNDPEGEHGFLGTQFTQLEQERILDTKVFGAGNHMYNVPAGNPTVDKIFLLSAEQVVYYTSMKPRRIAKTESSWWLLTPGKTGGSMAFVNPERHVMYYGYDARSDFYTVKPCIWVDISE